jgi:hypothetical protein
MVVCCHRIVGAIIDRGVGTEEVMIGSVVMTMVVCCRDLGATLNRVWDANEAPPNAVLL